AATSVVSASSCSLAPAFFARFEWIPMQYGHCVVSATATAISSLYFSGITPPLNAASSNARNPFQASGASSPSFLSFVRFFMSYMCGLLRQYPGPSARDITGELRQLRRSVGSARGREECTCGTPPEAEPVNSPSQLEHH